MARIMTGAPDAARVSRRGWSNPTMPKTPADRRAKAQALPPATPEDTRAIAMFLDRAWAEAGLSRLTLDSYRRDLDGLARWLAARGGTLAGVDPQGLFD